VALGNKVMCVGGRRGNRGGRGHVVGQEWHGTWCGGNGSVGRGKVSAGK
jgi:hypothetical protein